VDVAVTAAAGALAAVVDPEHAVADRAIRAKAAVVTARVEVRMSAP
jgi:hypothetical protein